MPYFLNAHVLKIIIILLQSFQEVISIDEIWRELKCWAHFVYWISSKRWKQLCATNFQRNQREKSFWYETFLWHTQQWIHLRKRRKERKKKETAKSMYHTCLPKMKKRSTTPKEYLYGFSWRCATGMLFQQIFVLWTGKVCASFGRAIFASTKHRFHAMRIIHFIRAHTLDSFDSFGYVATDSI